MKRDLAIETKTKAGKKVTLYGWVNSRRDHGKIIFLDLRDRTGIVQVVASPKYPGAHKTASSISNEDVIRVEGIVNKRPKENINPDLETGQVEVEAKEIKILNTAEQLPFPIDTDGHDIDEEVRLKYRYLDLRRPRLQKTIRLRSNLVQFAREYLFANDFVEIETPLLTKSTPEGSRDFIVPARLQPGKFYALPQSPQQYKQLLMVAGFERYFQIARCLRDEDLRADRAFEHTQIDLEMSFVEREDVMSLVEGLAIHVFEKLGAKIKQKPFPTFRYEEVMKKFGSDKFDLRSEKEKGEDVLAFAWVIDFPFFEKTPEGAWTYTHNPFSDPVPEHKEAFLKGKIEGILTNQYDLVCNGVEAAGGSIRSNDPRVLSKVFEVLGYSKADIEKKFGHMLTAFRLGAPPHGGIACGVDRWIMILTKETDLREVVAFPMTAGGRSAVMDAPSEVDPAQLKELGIKLEETTEPRKKKQ
jgi:aspartyl-tRNA synthetase